MFISIIIAILLTAGILSFIYSGIMCFIITQLSIEDEETLNIVLAIQFTVTVVCILLWFVTLLVKACCEGA